jgi:hypothetical protein
MEKVTSLGTSYGRLDKDLLEPVMDFVVGQRCKRNLVQMRRIFPMPVSLVANIYPVWVAARHKVHDRL